MDEKLRQNLIEVFQPRAQKLVESPEDVIPNPAKNINLRWYAHQEQFLEIFYNSEYEDFNIIWPRRHGKDLMCWVLLLREAVRCVGQYFFVYPTMAQGGKAIWKQTDENGVLLTDYIPKRWRMNGDGINKNENSITLANNSSVFLVDGAREGATRSSGAKMIVMNEFAEYPNRDVEKQMKVMLKFHRDKAKSQGRKDKASLIRIYTPKGYNHGWDAYMTSENSDKCYSQLLTRLDCRDHQGNYIVSDETYEECVREDGRTFAEQEYMCSFTQPVVGAFYSEEMIQAREEQRISHQPVNPELMTITGWDIGSYDDTAVWIAQIYGSELRLVDHISRPNESASFFVDWVQSFHRKHKLLKPYRFHFVPFDAKHHEWTSGERRIDAIYKLGLEPKATDLPKTKSVGENIGLVKRYFPQMKFCSDRVEKGVQSLSSYSREYDSDSGTYSDKPKKSRHNHSADALRYLITGIDYKRVFDINYRENSMQHGVPPSEKVDMTDIATMTPTPSGGSHWQCR